MKQKTAIRQLIEKLVILEDDNSLSTDYRAAILVVIQRARAFEPVNEQQIIDAYDQDLYGGLSGNRKFNDGEQYFTETFEKS